MANLSQQELITLMEKWKDEMVQVTKEATIPSEQVKYHITSMVKD